MNSTKDNKPNHQRNITPNFLRFKKKSTSKTGKGEQQGTETQYPTERSASKASRTSFDVYEKRVLDLNKLKNTLTLKEKENSVDPSKKKRQGLEVVTRRSNSTKKEQQEQGRVNIITKKPTSSNSNKTLKLRLTSTSRDNRKASNPKRSEESLQKQEERAKAQNKQLLNTIMQQQFAPNYMNKLKIKKMQQKQQKEKIRMATNKKKFLNVEFEIKGQQQLKYYQVYEQLGKGAYGVVKMGISKRTNQKVAIKIYDKKRLDQPNKLKNLERQINILAKLNHPVIAKLIDVIESTQEIYLIQEYGGANSLYNYLLSKPQHRMQEAEAKQFFRTITETLRYLHERNIVHRDIKAENILLNRNRQLKLIDFGFSLESEPPNNIDTFCGTPTYMAPEIVSKKDHVPIYTDLWSLGVFLFVILQGNYPFRAKNQNDLFQKIKKGQFQYIHKDISQKSKQVIERLMRVNPLERMQTTEMKQAFWEWYLSDSKPDVGEPTAVTNMTNSTN